MLNLKKAYPRTILRKRSSDRADLRRDRVDQQWREHLQWADHLIAPGQVELLEQRLLLSASPTGDEFRLNNTTAGTQQNVAVAMMENGDFVAVWESGSEGSRDVYMRRFNADGTAIDANDVRVNQITAGDQFNADVAIDEDGTIVVVFEGPGVGQVTPNTDIYARRFNFSGGAIDIGEFAISEEPEVEGQPFFIDQRDPSVAMNAAGQVVAAWEYELAEQLFVTGAASDSIDDLEELDFLLFEDQPGFDVDVAINEFGDFVAAWAFAGQFDGFNTGIFVQQFDINSQSSEDPFSVFFDFGGGETGPDSVTNPATDIDDNGNFVVLWEREDGENNFNSLVEGRSYNADGQSISDGAFFVAPALANFFAFSPDVALDLNGEFEAVFEMGNDGGSVYRQRFELDGTPIDEDAILVPTTGGGSKYDPAIAMNGDGNFIVAWAGRVDGDTSGVAAQRFSEVLPPSIEDIEGDLEGDEGDTFNFEAFTENTDGLTFDWDFGDDSGDSGTDLNEVSHVYEDDGIYFASLTVFNEETEESDFFEFEVEVNNVDPTITTFDVPSNGLVGELLNFAGDATDPGILDELTFEWDFGDGSGPVFGKNPTHTYNGTGPFTVTLTVTDDDEGQDIESTQINIGVEEITFDEVNFPEVLDEGEEGSFSAVASGGVGEEDGGDDIVVLVNNALTFTWDFGDGTDPVEGQNVNHTYADEGDGSYTVTVTAEDSEGNSAQTQFEVTVNNVDPVITSMNVPSNATEDSNVAMSATATDEGVDDNLTFTWDFGDGSSDATGTAVNHVYANPGPYTVTLTVDDGDGGEDVQQMQINVEEAEVNIDIDDIDAPDNLDEGEQGQFSADASASNEADLTYEWDFGDGTAPVEGQNVNHTFADEGTGTFNVTLRVFDGEGNETSTVFEVDVDNVDPVITSFNVPDMGEVGQQVNFSGDAFDDGVDDVLTFAWDFGDGSPTAFGKNVSHTYDDDGQYEVTLVVTDGDGGSDEASANIDIEPEPIIIMLEVTSISAPNNIIEGSGATFTANVDYNGEGTLVYTWDFGDGSDPFVTNSAVVAHTYRDDGNYEVSVEVSDGDGNDDSNDRDIIVQNANPIISALIVPSDANEDEPVPMSVVADDPGLDDVLSYSWDFGDGDSGNGANVQHTFDDPGEYTVTVTVTDGDGGIAVGQATIFISDVIIDQVGDDIKNARDLGIIQGQESSGDFVNSEGDFADVYCFRITGRGRKPVEIELTELDGDADMQLLNRRGKVLAESSNPDDIDEFIATNLRRGKYFVRVVPGKGATGPVAHTLNVRVDNAANVYQSAAKIGSIRQGRTIRDYTDGKDIDLYKIKIGRRGADFFARMDPANSTTPSMELLDSGGRLMRFSQDGGAGVRTMAFRLKGGTYYVKIDRSGEIASGVEASAIQGANYDLTMFAEVDKAGGTMVNAAGLGGRRAGSFRPGKSISLADQIGGIDQNDFFQFMVASDSTITARILDLSDDLDMRLYDSSGAIIAQSLNNGTANEQIMADLARGQYFLEVTGATSDAQTSYTLNVEAT